MELEFTADQLELRDSIRVVLQKASPVKLAREVAENQTGADRLWRVVTELGWAALTVPEKFGGIGLGAVEAGILAEELGRVIAPGPLLATVAQFVPAVSLLGNQIQQERWLAPVAAGGVAGTATYDSGVLLRFDGNDSVLNGRCSYVIEAAAAEFVACRFTSDLGEGMVVIEKDEAKIVPIVSIDPTRQIAHIVFKDVRLSADRVLGGPAAIGKQDSEFREATLHGVSAIALETVGVCQSIFDVALDHVKNREQFGVPIGSFQAIKHKFADMLVTLERARATSYLSALCVAERVDRAGIETSAAKVAAADCQRLLAKEGIQLLGGIGYTWEHDMHLYVKRAKANDALFGTASHHRARIADLLGV